MSIPAIHSLPCKEDELTCAGHVYGHTRYELSLIPSYHPIQTQTLRGEESSRRENPLASEAWIIALRAIDALLSVAVRPSTRREKRKVGRRKWREERGGKSSLCCNRSLPIHVEIIARCGSHRDSKLSGNVCRAVFSAESSFLPPQRRERKDRTRQPADYLFGDLGIKRPPGRLSEDLFIIRWQRSRRRVMSIECISKADAFSLKEMLRSRRKKFETVLLKIISILLKIFNCIKQIHLIDSGAQKNTNYIQIFQKVQ